MAVVARTRQREHVLSGEGTLLDLCLLAGLPVASACSGQGACGKCVLTVLEGGATLPPPTEHEAAVLTRNAATSDQRLGCQCAWFKGQDALLIATGYW